MNKIISIPMDSELGPLIGKKGSETSMSFYNRKVGSDIIVAIAPSDIEGKFYALPNTMILGEQIIISTALIDSLFGEVMIAASILDKRVIFTKDSDIGKFMSALEFKNHAFSEKEEIVPAIEAYPTTQKEGAVKVEIDRCFNVKGVGTVLLGVVTRGVLHKHDKLFRPGKEIVVRSIQCQDEDVESADLGSRVGLAVKGVTEEDIRKGDVLSTTLIPGCTSINVQLKVSKAAGETVAKATQYSIFSGFNSGSCTIESLEGSLATLKLDKELQLEKGDTILLGRNKKPRLFASGVVQ